MVGHLVEHFLGCLVGHWVECLVGHFDCILVGVVVKEAKVEVAVTGDKVGIVALVSRMITLP